MNYLRMIFWVLFLFSGLIGEEYKIEFIRTIGDESRDYTFFRLSSGVFSENMDVYVGDQSGYFIAKYDRDGKFVKKIGQKGSGPGDFENIRHLAIYKEKLYVFDHANTRIVELDLDLNIKNYIKLPGRFFRYCFPITDTLFLGDFFALVKDEGRIGIVNRNGVRTSDFFNTTSIGTDFNWQDRTKILRLASTGSLIMDISPEKDRVLISFLTPDNPIQFFIYSVKGELLSNFSYKADNRFRFPGHLLESKSSAPQTFHFLQVDSVFFYKSNYVAFCREVNHNNKKYESEDFGLIFDKAGKLLQRIELDKDKKMWFFDLSEDGYLIGTDQDADIAKLYIYRVEMK